LLALDRDSLVAEVNTDGLRVDGDLIGLGGPIERDVVRRLRAADVASLEIRRDITVRSLTRFCQALIAEQAADGRRGLDRRLADLDVQEISVRIAAPPEVLAVHASVEGLHAANEQRRWREAQGKRTPSAHLYPPERGWVRVDPALDVASLSLHDIAVLVEDPAEMAAALDQLAGRTETEGDAGDALIGHFSEVARILEALDPSLAAKAFARLGQAVLALDSERRTRLLTGTVLPALLEGRAEGALLPALPDVDLADALALVLDTEAAAPELLSAALDRLNLAADRRENVIPLLTERIRQRAASGDAKPQRDTALDERIQRLVRVATDQPKSFHEFVGLDLAIDPATEAALASTQRTIDGTDGPMARLRCTAALVRQSRNADAITHLMPRLLPLLTAFARAGRWHDIAPILAGLNDHARAVADVEPDGAVAVRTGLDAVVDPDCIDALARLRDRGTSGRATVDAIVEALGPGLAVPATACLTRDIAPEPRRRVAEMLAAYAGVLAPALADLLPGLPIAAAVPIIRALSQGGRGVESLLAAQLQRTDEPVVREALRALARIGSSDALRAVMAHLHKERAVSQATAEGALWAFPRELSRAATNELLAEPRFVARHPALAVRLLDHLAKIGVAGLEATLMSLTPLRFRVWNPALARVGRRARLVLGGAR
jgi:hypothetical protein